MKKFLFSLLIPLFSGAIFLFAAESAGAATLSRPALLSLAHNFVSRMEQKMPGLIQQDPLRYVPEGEVLLLQPRIRGDILIDGQVSALRRGPHIYLSLGGLFDSLAFPIHIDFQNNSAHGWYIRENFGFDLDLEKGFVVSRGQEFVLTNDEWFIEDNEIYVLSTSINKWMKIDSDYIWDSLLIDLVADVPFPLEDKLKRRKEGTPYDKKDSRPKLPRVEAPYEMAGVPRVNARMTQDITKSPGDATDIRRTMRVDTAGDLLGMTTRTFSTLSNDGGLDNFRFTMEREDETGDMMGPFQATRVEVGDLAPRGLDMAGYVTPGLGGRITNNKGEMIAGQASRTFEGDVPPDWDVELYEEDTLVGFQSVGTDGRYRFENVDLFAGDNNFRLVFYGPQGEIREEQVSLPIDISDVGSDQHLYDISLSLADTQTFTDDPSRDVDKNTPQLVVTYNRGLREGLSVNAGVETIQTNEKQKLFANIGAALRSGKTLWNFDVLADDEAEGAFRTIVRRQISSHDLFGSATLRTPNYNPDHDDDISGDRFETRLGLRGPLPQLFGQAVSYHLDTTYNGDYEDSSDLATRLSLNTRFRGISLGETFQYTRAENNTTTTEEYLGSTSVRTNILGTRMRGDVQYELSPDPAWHRFLLDAERNITETASVRGEVTLENPNRLEGAISSNWRMPKYTVTPRVSYNSDHDLRATVSVNLGALYDPKGNKVYLTNASGINSGALRAFVFFDQNGNNLFDGKDEPLSDVKVISAQVSRSARTDESGVAMITDLPEYHVTDVMVDRTTLPDPYYVVGYEGASVYARPGKPISLEFPVHLSGEMDGTIMTAKESFFSAPSQAAGGLHIDLIDPSGNIAVSTVSAFDGYYVLSTIPPGAYLAKIRSEDLVDTNLRQPTPRLIQVGYDGKLLADQNIELVSGREIPINIRRVEKNKMDEAKPEPIAIDFGTTYRSPLMAQLMRLRLSNILRQHTDIPLPVSVVSQDLVKGLKKSSGYGLQTTLPPTSIDDAQEICRVVAERKIPCTVTVSPQVLFARESQITTADKNGTSRIKG